MPCLVSSSIPPRLVKLTSFCSPSPCPCNAAYLILVLLALVLGSSNLYGYVKASRDQSKKISDFMGTAKTFAAVKNLI